jgi:hypothetical protein
LAGKAAIIILAAKPEPMESKSLLERGKNYIKNSWVYTNVKYPVKNFLIRNRFLDKFIHPYKSIKANAGIVPPRRDQADDSLLIERLKKSYLISDANFDGNKVSVWSDIFQQLHGDIHSAFINGDQDKMADILRNPGKYNLFYGFENLSRDLLNRKWLDYTMEPKLAMDALVTLCEAVGVLKISNPETLKIVRTIDPERAIQLLDGAFGFNLSFPNPFEGESGIQTKLGIINYRAVQAIYQAWRISEIVKDIPGASVLEIGGGLGRTAYYCWCFGIHDYTIVDIPISSLAQGDFLGRALSEKDLLLIGESTDQENYKSKIKLIHPKAFAESTRKYDLIVNVDSLTELDVSIAKDYLHKISQKSKLFLSINHENNRFTVNAICKETGVLKPLYRVPYWVRKGYAEELFEATNILSYTQTVQDDRILQ